MRRRGAGSLVAFALFELLAQGVVADFGYLHVEGSGVGGDFFEGLAFAQALDVGVVGMHEGVPAAALTEELGNRHRVQPLG